MSDGARVQLEWGIKASFRDYLQALPDAREEHEGVEVRDGEYVFPGRADDALQFTGRVHLSGHGGVLDVILADPAIEATDDGLVLTADIGGTRQALARLLDAPGIDELVASGGEVADVALTIHGAGWLGGVYAPWTRVDPIRVSASTPRA